MILLNQQAVQISRIPKNSDALNLLRSGDQHISDNTEAPTLESGEACVTLWNEGGVPGWNTCFASRGYLIPLEFFLRV